jgi:hypothetical protein
MTVDDDEAGQRTMKRTSIEKSAYVPFAIAGLTILAIFVSSVIDIHLAERLMSPLGVVMALAALTSLALLIWGYEKRAKPPYQFSRYVGFWLATIGFAIMVCAGVAMALLQMITPPPDFLSESVSEDLSWTVVGAMLFACLGFVVLLVQLIPIAFAELRKPFTLNEP